MPQEKMTMDEVRARFPEYDDMDDMTLANAIHGRFYSDMPLAQFYEQVGFNPQTDAGDNGIYPETRPGFSQDNPVDLATADRATAAGLTRGTWVRGPDGTVYALPSDATEGAYRAGDEAQAPGVYVRPQSGIEDVVKSFPTGVVEGLTGLAGLQGTLGEMVGMEPGQYLPGLGVVGPSGEDFNQMIREGLGRDYYQPQTVAGEYSRTAGEFLPGVVAPGGVGAKAASWLVPAATSETSGQLARMLQGGQRDTAAEGFARMGGGLLGGLGVGGANAIRGGADISLRNAAPNVTPEQLQMAAALRQRGGLLGVDLTNAEALQQATGGATGLGRLQRVVEGQAPQMSEFFARRPQQVAGAIEGELNRLGPLVPPSQLAHQSREAADTALNRIRERVNAQARPFYGAADQQVISAEEYAALQELPSYRMAEAEYLSDPVLSRSAPGPQSMDTVNRVIQRMDRRAREFETGTMASSPDFQSAAAHGDEVAMAKMLADAVSPDYAQARAIGAAGRQGELAPTQRGPIGSIAAQPELQPNLLETTNLLFPAQPFRGQADETAQALRLMGEVDPTVGGPLVRQHLERQAMEAQQALATGDNQFGGANFAARAFGNPEQRRTVMGAIDATAPRVDPDMAFPEINPNAQRPMPSDPMAQLVEVLQATGQRHRGGSETAFNAEAIRNLQGGNLATGAAQTITNPAGVFGRVGKGIDDWTARRNAETLADLLMANSDEFNARLTRAINRPRGANRIRAGVTLGAGQED